MGVLIHTTECIIPEMLSETIKWYSLKSPTSTLGLFFRWVHIPHCMAVISWPLCILYYDYTILLWIILVLHALINANCSRMSLIDKPLLMLVCYNSVFIPVYSPNTCKGVFNPNILIISKIVQKVCSLLFFIFLISYVCM